jgi:PAS domain S-box-containing protein
VTPRAPTRRYLVGTFVASAASYWLLGRLALLMAIPPGYATAVWPAAGVALVCVLVWGLRVAPAIAIGSLCVNIGTSLESSSAEAIARSVAVATSIAIGAALQALLGAWLIRRRIGFPTALDDERDILRFTALAGPIACLVNCSIGVTVLAVVGAVEPSAFAFNWFTWWAGDTIGVLVFTPVALVFAPGVQAVWRRRRFVVGLPLVVGSLAVTAVFVRASAWERGRLRTDFERRAAPVASVLRSDLSSYAEVVAGLASFFDASHDVTREEFRRYSSRALETYHGLLALSWNPLVTSDQRARHEADARADGLTEFMVTERDSSGALKPATARPEYTPVYYIEPQLANERALGYDIASDEIRGDMLRRARARLGTLAASARVDLVQNANGRSGAGILLAAGVTYHSGSPGVQLRGFVVAAFRIDDLIDVALREIDHAGMTLTLRDADGANRLLFGVERARPAATGMFEASRFPIELGGRRWALEVAPTAAYISAQRSWQAWLVLAAGLFFVGLLGVVLLMTTGRTSRLEAMSEKISVSEAKYRELYEESPDMYLTAAMQGASATVVDVNRTLCDRLGYEKAELIGEPFHIVYHPEYLEQATQRTVTFQQIGEFVDVERTLRTKVGGSIDVSLNLRAVRDGEGRVVGARAVWRDIGKRKQIERDRQFLVQLVELLRSSVDIDVVLTSVCAELGRYLRVKRCAFVEIDANDKCFTIRNDYHDGVPSIAGTLALSEFGLDSLVTEQHGQTVVVEDATTEPRTHRYEGAYARVGTAAEIAVPLLRDGTWVVSLFLNTDVPRVWEKREVTLVELVAERVWSWVEHLRVLGELRVRAVDAAVRHTEERFRTLVEGMTEYAIMLLDPSGDVVSWNDGAARLTGYASREILGSSVAILHEEGHLEQLTASLAEARQTGRFVEEAWRVRKDGTRFWADVAMTPLFDSAGKLEGYAKVIRDFTTRREQDETLRQSLREREVLLQEVHHRVKNNLQVISSLINMQVRRLEPGMTRDALDECKQRVLTIALIHEKLYQSKDYAHVPFAEYVRSLASQVMHVSGHAPHVALQLDIQDVPLGVDRAIPCGLILNELISNALKHAFRDRSRGRIRVELLRMENKLRLIVADDGIGLPPGFDTRRSTSMGLQLVYTLARQLEADLSVTSDGGTTFHLTFAGNSELPLLP